MSCRASKRIAELGTTAMSYAKAHHRPDEPGWGWLAWPDFKIFWDAPVLIIISGRVEDCCRAGQTLTLSAHARGLGTCWVGSPMLWLNTDEAKAKLRIPPDRTPVSAFCLGYPEDSSRSAAEGSASDHLGQMNEGVQHNQCERTVVSENWHRGESSLSAETGPKAAFPPGFLSRRLLTAAYQATRQER